MILDATFQALLSFFRSDSDTHAVCLILGAGVNRRRKKNVAVDANGATKLRTLKRIVK